MAVEAVEERGRAEEAATLPPLSGKREYGPPSPSPPAEPGGCRYHPYVRELASPFVQLQVAEAGDIACSHCYAVRAPAQRLFPRLLQFTPQRRDVHCEHARGRVNARRALAETDRRREVRTQRLISAQSRGVAS